MERRVEVLVFFLRKNTETNQPQVLLGLKKERTGKGKRNGYGGGVKSNETLAQAVKREVKEELGVDISIDNLKRMADINLIIKTSLFRKFSHELTVYVSREKVTNFLESEEMEDHTWYPVNRLPDVMKTDLLWLPYVLNGDIVEGSIIKKNYGKKEIIVDLKIIGPVLK
jgi:8-oxo-dGTP pyrophosphatase MutT (NUDIX family)